MPAASSRSIARWAVVKATSSLPASLFTVQNGFSANRSIALSGSLDGAFASCSRQRANVQHGLVRQVGHEAHWVGLRHRQSHVIVEADIGVARRIPYLARQRRLAALARPVHEDHGRVGERLRQAGARKAGVERGLGHAGQV